MLIDVGRGGGGALKPGLLRTFQRRVRPWRLAEGPEKEVFFTQDHAPGAVLAVDWTDMGGLGVAQITSKEPARGRWGREVTRLSGRISCGVTLSLVAGVHGCPNGAWHTSPGQRPG